MSEEMNATDDQSILENSPTNKLSSKKATPKKIKNTPIMKQGENQVQKRGALKQSELVKWTVFVRPEVKIAVQKSAKKAGITDTAWLDDKLWVAATDDLSKKPQLPAKPEDVADILKQFTEKMAASQEAAQATQEATIKAQGDLINQQGQQITALAEAVQNSQPKSLKEMIFGKKKGS